MLFNNQKNYDLLGGWVCHSPLQEEARGKYIDMDSMKDISLETDHVSDDEDILEEGTISIAELLLTDNFYFVVESNRDITFMEDFYKSKGKKVTLELQETIGEGENPFMVYQIVEQ